MSELIQIIGNSNCGDCSQSIKIKGCADNVPYLQIVNSTGINPATVTFINLLDGTISATAPANYVAGDCPLYEETDLIKTNWLPLCVDGLQWYVLESSTYNNATLVETTPIKLYKQGADGAIVTVAPTGIVIADGNCQLCKKEIFAVHDRFISVPGVPVGAVAYEMTNDLPTQGLDVSNAYFHLIYPTLNGTQNIAYGPQLTDYFANPQLGILWSDIAGVQAVIDFVLPLMNLSVGDVVYAINTSNLPIFFLSPTAVAELANNTFLHIYWGSVDTHNNYNEKADVNVVAANPNILLGGENKCVGIQEIKEKDTCTGEETYRYVIEDLNGNLVKVTDIYPDFVEADVLLECPVVSKTVDVPNCAGTLVEKEVDSIVGAYILNQENKHTETVYDIVNAAIGGTITYTYTSPTNIALNLNTVTVTNDSLVGFWTDFGDGYNDFGNVPDHSYNADGSYEIKTYAILNSKNKILINAKEVIITNGVVAYAPTGTSSTINRPYRHVVNTALQNYCGNTPVDNPYLADGTSYTPTGTLGLHLDAIIDELEYNAEWNPENVADLVECVVGSANLVTEALDVNLGAIKEVVSPGSTLTTFHTLLGNNLDIQGDGLTYHMGAGINANISGSTYIGAQFTYTFNLIGEDDPGDPADFGITVWDNVAGTSVTATSITSTATYAGDAQGSGLNVPFYAWGAPGTYTIVWTGDLPVGDYTIGYMNQNFSPADHVELQVTHNLVDSMTTSKAQLVEICNPQVEIDLVKTNWLPICINGVQWFVAENSTIDNSSGSETTNVKVYKQGAYGPVTNTTPAGIATSKEGYCQTLKSCGAVGEVTTIPSKLLSNAEIDTIMFNLLGVNVPKQYANLPNTSFPQIINYQGTTGNIFYGYNIDTSKYACGTNVRANVTLLYTPLGDSDPVDTGLDIIFLGANPAYTTLNFIGAPNGTPVPLYPTKVVTKLYPAIPASLQSIGATYDITGLSSFNILSYVQGINATDSVRIEGLAIEIISGDFTACQIALPVKDCNSTAILDALKQILNKQPNAVVANVLENASQNRITGVLALNSITAVNPTFTGARDVTVYNTKNVTVAFEYTTTVNGTMHRQNIPANSTWSNTLKRDAYSNEGTYTSGQIVTAYTAASAAGEININWTT